MFVIVVLVTLFFWFCFRFSDDVIGVFACWYPMVCSVYYNATFDTTTTTTTKDKDDTRGAAIRHQKCAKMLHTWIVVSAMYFLVRAVQLLLPSLAWNMVLSDMALGNGKDKLATLIFLLWLHCPWTDGVSVIFDNVVTPLLSKYVGDMEPPAVATKHGTMLLNVMKFTGYISSEHFDLVLGALQQCWFTLLGGIFFFMPSPFSQIGALYVGILCPCYVGAKTIQRRQIHRYLYWLRYWVVFASFERLHNTLTDSVFGYIYTCLLSPPLCGFLSAMRYMYRVLSYRTYTVHYVCIFIYVYIYIYIYKCIVFGRSVPFAVIPRSGGRSNWGL